MSEQSKNRRWFQFTLRMLLGVVMLVAVACGLQLGIQAVAADGGLSTLSVNELCMFAFVTAVAALAGGIYVARTPPRQPILLRIVGSSFVSGFVLFWIAFVFGVASGVQSGKDIAAVLGEGFATGLIYGFGLAIFGIPGAILGGIIGAFFRRIRLRASDLKRIDDKQDTLPSQPE